jgi:hypothetical protein
MNGINYDLTQIIIPHPKHIFTLPLRLSGAHTSLGGINSVEESRA